MLRRSWRLGPLWFGSKYEKLQGNDRTGEEDNPYIRLKRTSPFNRQNKRAQARDLDAMEAGLVQRKIERIAKMARMARI